MSGPFSGHFRLCLINSTEVISSKVAKFGSMDIVELHGNILQPGGQLEPPGLVASKCMIWLLLSLKSLAYQMEENYSMLNCLDYISTISLLLNA